MSKPLDITDLSVHCSADGSARVAVWCKCYSPEDVDDVIAWLDLARTFMKQWQEIRKGEHDENSKGR